MCILFIFKKLFLLILTWLSTSKILPPLLYKKCRYDAWESIQDFDNLQLVPSLLTEYDKGRYIWDNIGICFCSISYPKEEIIFTKFILKWNFWIIKYQAQGAEILIKFMKIHPKSYNSSKYFTTVMLCLSGRSFRGMIIDFAIRKKTCFQICLPFTFSNDVHVRR